MAINLQTSFLSPPFGFSLFYLRGVADESIKTTDICQKKASLIQVLIWVQVWALVSVPSRSRDFFIFLQSRNRSRKNLVPKKVLEPVSKKIGTEKSLGTGLEKFWYRKSLGTGLEKIWYRKKVSEPVSFRFWVSSHTDLYLHQYKTTMEIKSTNEIRIVEADIG